MPRDYSIGRRLMGDFQRDYGMSTPQAAGFVGNLAHESDNFRQLQEAKPLVPGSRGGYGFAQWTGARRRAFEAWANDKGLAPSSYEANYGFLRHEIDNTPEGRFMSNLLRTNDVGQATRIVQDQFLRPGVPHTDSRLNYAQTFAGLGGDNSGSPYGLPTSRMQAPAMGPAGPYGLQTAQSSGSGGDFGAAQIAANQAQAGPMAQLGGMFGVAPGMAATPYAVADNIYGLGGQGGQPGQMMQAPYGPIYGYGAA